MELSEDAMRGFDDITTLIQQKDMPSIALERHQEAIATVNERFTEYQQKVDALLTATDRKTEDKAYKQLKTFIEKQQFAKSRQHSHQQPSPVAALAKKVRQPHSDSVALQRYLQIPFTQLAALNSTGLLENTKTPAPEDLGQSIDIQLTEAIQQKAAELNHNPVDIYTWVHNNVQFVPSFGSIQGADYTLQSLKGNSFDTASLLIALLRASNISARYAYGTIDVPLEKAMNWVGGV